MDLIPSVLSDLIAGLAASGIVASAALVARRVAWGTARRLATFLGWPTVAAAFFVVSLISAILRGGTESIAVLGVLLVLTASVMLLRFGPARLHVSAPAPVQPVVGFIQTYPWRLLTGFFFLTTVGLLLINVGPADDHPDRIVFVVDLDDWEMLGLREIVDELEGELGAEVLLMNVKSKRHVPRLDKMLASGDMKWDLIATDNNMVGVLGAKGLVRDLSEYAEYDDIIPQSLLPSLRPLIKYEGRFYFAPFRPNVKIAFYNEKKFALYGLDPPRNWDDLLEVARVFKTREGVGCVAIQGAPGKTTAVTTFEFVMAAGGNPLTLDDDGAREAFAFLKELEPYLVRDYTETDFNTANELLLVDEVCLVNNWPFGIKVVVEEAGKTEIKAYSGWKGPEGEVHVLGGDILAVPKDAPHPELAIKLIELLLSEETQEKLVSRLGWPPVRLDVTIPLEMVGYFDAVQDALSFAEIRPNVPQWTLAEECLDHAFRALIVDGNSIEMLPEHSACLEEIPSQFDLYEVRPGETLSIIARRYRATPDMLATVNGITARTHVIPGQVLLVPGE